MGGETIRRSQWFVLGLGFFILGLLLAFISLQFGSFCNYNFENAIACIRQQVYSVFPYIFFLLTTVCFINGYIEGRAEEKQELNKIVERIDREDLLKIAKELKLKEIPQDVDELVHIAGREGKEDKAVKLRLDQLFERITEEKIKRK